MNKKLNILMVSDSFYPVIGGREHVIHNLMQNLSSRSAPLLLTGTFKGQNKKELNTQKYKTIRCKSLRLTKNEYLNFIDRKTKKQIESLSGSIDIIHTQTKFALARFAIKLGKRLGVPVVTTCHTNYPLQYKSQLKVPILYKPFLRHTKRTINFCFRVFTISSHMKEVLVDMGVNRPILVIPNGNDLEDLTLNDTSINLAQNHSQNSAENLFIFVGRITKAKNLSLLLNALKRVKESGVSFKTIFVGDGDIKKYSSLAQKLGIGENCVFAGKITDRQELFNLYRASKLNLFPSVCESFGLTVRESASAGVPSVVIEGSAPAEDIVHGKNGYISPCSPEDFANTIMLALNDPNLKEVGEQAKKISKSWNEVTKLHLKEYETIIEEYNKQKSV